MSKFITVKIRERTEGEPGFLEAHEYELTINADQVVLFNAGEDPKITFVRLSCGATVCVLMTIKKFKELVESE